MQRVGVPSSVAGMIYVDDDPANSVTDALGYCRGGSTAITGWTNNIPAVDVAYGVNAIGAFRGHSIGTYPNDATVFRVADNAPGSAWTVGEQVGNGRVLAYFDGGLRTPASGTPI